MQQGILNISLEQIITDTIVATWRELIGADSSPLVHVEYHRAAPNKEVQYLKVWAREEKGWRLVCQYWVSTSDGQDVKGLTFCHPFYSASLGHLLMAVLENQGTFSDLCDQTHDGLIQIHAPSDQERETAVASLQVALTDRGLCDVESAAE
jgi:hypothetical protein